MLVLFESALGYGLFKLNDGESVLSASPSDISSQYFSSAAQASATCNLVKFKHFSDTVDAVSCATAAIEGKVSKTLKSFLKKHAGKEELIVSDKALGASIRDKLSIPCVENDRTHEIIRGIREHVDGMLGKEGGEGDLKQMQLGLSHSLGRYKLKFSPDKVDTMVVQAIGLLDDLDKEINTYAMRVKEWYGWHFPEMAKILNDNTHYARVVLECGMRSNYKDVDLSHILDDETTESALKEAAEISMGTEISEMDRINISSLAEQVISLSEYRAQLYEYLKNRMNAIAPNLTIMVGELVGARLISHAGSLMNLAKHPASTVQILGAEKALFRALKTKHDTPKYGLIYHASLIGQTTPKNKGKISRVLAAKSSLAIRVDALGDGSEGTAVGQESRAKVEARIRSLDGGIVTPGAALTTDKIAKHVVGKNGNGNGTGEYNAGGDIVNLDDKEEKEKKKKKKKEKKEKKRKAEESVAAETQAPVEQAEPPAKKAKKEKKKKKEKA